MSVGELRNRRPQRPVLDSVFRNAGGILDGGRLSLDRLVPPEGGDAPGRDPESVPRYPGTTRILSAQEDGMPQRLAVWSGAGSPEIAERF